MCLFWKARQRRLHIDDFGNPLDNDESHQHGSDVHSTSDSTADHSISANGPTLLSQQEPTDAALSDAMETTPLLPPQNEGQRKEKTTGIFSQLWR